jgi:hypothetical protein
MIMTTTAAKVAPLATAAAVPPKALKAATAPAMLLVGSDILISKVNNKKGWLLEGLRLIS